MDRKFLLFSLAFWIQCRCHFTPSNNVIYHWLADTGSYKKREFKLQREKKYSLIQEFGEKYEILCDQ